MSEILLKINGVALPIPSGGDLTQDYEAFGGFTNPPRRFASGAGLLQHRWERLRTRISCNGWHPAALAGFDFTQPFTLACVAPRGITQASNVFTLPTARRSDVAVVAKAIHGEWSEPAAVNVVGNTATVTTAPGATGYQCWYWPLLTVAGRPQEKFDLTTATAGWELTAEEI